MSDAHRFALDGGRRSDAQDRLRMQAARGAGGAGESAAPVRSPEVTAAVVLLAAIGAAALAGPSVVSAGAELLRFFFARVASAGAGAGLTGVLPAALGYAARLAAPLLAAGFGGAVAGHLVQSGLPITLRSVAPRWTRIAPSWTRLGRRLWSAETAFNLGRELLKVGAVVVIAALNIGAALRLLAAAPAGAGGGAPLVAAATFGAALRLAVQSAIALLLLAVADYLFRYFRERRRSQRTVAETREERRLQEGDPVVRDRLRARMRALLARTVADQVAAADVVIADAARAAVALRWDRLTMTAPVVVAKAAAGSVGRLRAAADAGGVAVVDNAALAGSLYSTVALGDAIPRSFEPAVAAILAARLAARRGPLTGGAPWRQ
jgi:flagellar biosynthetic protein FlhB